MITVSYASRFLASDDAARDLLLETGYSSSAAIEAVTKLSELCVYVEIIQKMAEEHVKGENLPPHYETSIELKPIKLRGSTTVDLLEELESRNVIVPRSGKYRVMLSNMMNRVFSLTANDEDESIRAAIAKLHDADKFANALETIEWELVSAIHDNIDVKYLDLPTLEANKIPFELIEQVNRINEIVQQLEEREIDLDETSNYLIDTITRGREGQENLKLVRTYLVSIKRISELIQSETEDRWALIQGATKYPQSLLRRNSPPMIKSSWHLRPDFRNHPLIEKFKDLMSTNMEFMAGVLTLYDSQITNVIDTIEELPRGTDLIETLHTTQSAFPTSDEVESWWEILDRKAPGLKAQVKLLNNVINNTDSLFQSA